VCVCVFVCLCCACVCIKDDPDIRRRQGSFDLLSGQDFDLLALRSFRREARLRYANLNQVP
jgi:hypothetical protein